MNSFSTQITMKLTTVARCAVSTLDTIDTYKLYIITLNSFEFETITN